MNKTDYQAMRAKGAEALADPRPGDYWHEMFSYRLFVVDVIDDYVLTVDSFGMQAGQFFHEHGRPDVRTKAEFRDYLSYRSIPGTWVDLLDRGVDTSDMKALFEMVPHPAPRRAKKAA